jgi:hypothetical protein
MIEHAGLSATVNPVTTPGPPPRPGAVTTLSQSEPPRMATEPFKHPGPPPPFEPFKHPGPPPPFEPFKHPGPPPPFPEPFKHPGPPPGGGSALSPSALPVAEGTSRPSIFIVGEESASSQIKVQLRHTQEIVSEKPVKNTSFSSKAAIVDIVPFSGTPKSIMLVGNAPGDAHVTFLFTDGTADRVPVSVAF